ncbi:sensor histidine kinase [Lysobacter korlensis]|uniref:Sensor histidine kinase n=1 Tax=Lysobacter korlensis TaxID=553636 RepID=A0ABV6RV01_9GAMM
MPGETSARVVALVALGLGLAGCIAAIALDVVIARLGETPPMSAGWSGALPGLAMLLPGALLFWRLPWHPIASVLLGFGMLWCIDGTASAWVNYAALIDPDAPLATFAFWFYARFGAVLLLPFQLLLLLFPDGRFPRRGPWRVVAIASLVAVCMMPLAEILAPRGVGDGFGDPHASEVLRFDQPVFTLPLTPEIWGVIGVVVTPVVAAGTFGCLAVALSRRIGASPEQRSQLRWLLWAGVIFILDLTVGFVVLPEGVVREIVGIFVIALFCVAVVIAVTRYRLYSIDRLLSWTLVYGLILGGVVLVDVALVALVGSVLDERTSAIVAVLIVTMLYAPLRERLFSLASRLVNGRRDDPYGVVSALATRLEESAESERQLEDLAHAVAEAFASSYVRVELDRPSGQRIVAESGTPRAETITLPLEYRGASIGRIEMEPGRRPRLSERDRRLLDDVARQAAAAVLATETSTELQRIRARLVTAREEERSRLRRQLHDELGPLLGGIKLRLEAARNLGPERVDEARDLLSDAAAETSGAVADIRRLVHDLRPPALDDLGLAGALAQLRERFEGAEDLEIELHFDVPVKLRPAVEVAVYRIVAEALQNVARHSGAKHCWVTVGADWPDADRIAVEVLDDGAGIAPDAFAGAGLAAQRERALELGGSWSVTERAGGGTRVLALLPLGAEILSGATFEPVPA